MAKVAQEVEGHGIKARSVVSVGSAVDEIVNVAEREEVGLIAMATHGRSGMSRWIRGSVADAVTRQTSLPCLLIHPNELEAPQTRLAFTAPDLTWQSTNRRAAAISLSH